MLFLQYLLCFHRIIPATVKSVQNNSINSLDILLLKLIMLKNKMIEEVNKYIVNRQTPKGKIKRNNLYN
jgi:hypothetical protein